MRFLFFILLLSTPLMAETDPFSHKKGIVFGLGGTVSRYTFPADFDGVDSDQLDDKSTLYGGALQLGYDVVLFNRLLLGLRGEGMVSDTMAAGNKSGNVLRGKARATNALLRTGILFDTKLFDMVGDPARMIFEIFVEGGITSGHRSISKQFSTTDDYVDNLEEEYQGSVLSAGLNLTTRTGAFFELKGMNTNMTNTRQKFTGHKVENGGAEVPTDRILDEKKNFMTFLVIMGHHF